MIKDNSGDGAHIGRVHRIANDGKSLLANFVVRDEEMRRVVPNPSYGIRGNKFIAVDRPCAFEGDGIELLVLKRDVFALAPLVAFDLIFIVDRPLVSASM